MRCMKTVLIVFGVLAAILSPGAASGDEAFERALSLAAEKRYSDAREVLDPLLEREPGHRRARLLHGVLRARAGRVGEAIDIFEALRRDHPEMSEPYNNLAVLYAVGGRLEDAREILLATLKRQPDAVVYANLGDVYTKLARRAYQQARELEAGGGAHPEQETDTTFAIWVTPDDSSETGMRGATAEPQNPPMEPRETATESGGPAVQSRDGMAKPPEGGQEPADLVPQGWESATESQDAVPESRESVAPTPTVTADAQRPDPESRDTREDTAGKVPAASEAASMPSAFCARAGGFQGRRAVADAALWLQSYGAEVVEVRHEERRIASSYRVYLPPFESREEAEAKLREIRKRGVRDVAVIKDGDLANGISFGIYREADNMHRRVAALDRLGYPVRSHAADLEIVEEYVIKARAGGAPDTLDGAWTSRFPEQSIRVVDCG